jgi:type I restriction enzyme M protein
MEVQISDNGKEIYAPLKKKWLVLTPEEKVRQEYIKRLVDNYGYSVEQMRQEILVAEGNGRGTGKASADIIVWASTEDVMKRPPVIVVECKAENINISTGDYWQGSHYARYVKAPFFVTSNLKQTKVFKVNLEGFPTDLGDEILDIPSLEDLGNKKKLQEIQNRTKSFTRDEFSRLLFRCHNIIRNNDKLSPEAAFDEISKILFMKIRYERNPNEDNVFSLKQFKKEEAHYEKNIRPVNVKRNGEKDNIPYMDYWFELTKAEFEKDDLFDPNDTIKIKQTSFESIVEELQKYNLSTTSDDVKGIAFEKFLGKTFRGELGQFFTPRSIVDFMVELLDPQEGEIICDPCCGSGGFLIKAFEYVREKIEKDIIVQKELITKCVLGSDLPSDPEKRDKERVKVNPFIELLERELDTSYKGSRLHHLANDCIFGTDANPRMAHTSKMNMIMHGDGHCGVHHRDGLLNINGIFENRFDVILTNPPFGARVEKTLEVTKADCITDPIKIKEYEEKYGEETYQKAMSQVNDNVGKSLLGLYDVGKLSGLTEVLFLERCLRLLKPGGRLGIVLPEGVLNTTNLQSVRELFEGMAKIILITSIPQDVFVASGATVKPSILFFKKFTKEEKEQYKKAENDARTQVEAQYASKLAELQEFIDNTENSRSDIKIKKSELKALKSQIEQEIKPIVKQLFDYQIPVAQVEKAGITTTGAECENELDSLLEEYVPYRKENNLWYSKTPHYSYKVENNVMYKRVNGGTWEILK